jgi:hypothetical protein
MVAGGQYRFGLWSLVYEQDGDLAFIAYNQG